MNYLKTINLTEDNFMKNTLSYSSKKQGRIRKIFTFKVKPRSVHKISNTEALVILCLLLSNDFFKKLSNLAESDIVTKFVYLSSEMDF